MVTGTSAPIIEFDTDAELLPQVLRPYRDHCKYLRSAVVRARDGLVSATCTFEIPESCYIDDTGHFNAVEFNICYNQMAYYTIAKAIKDQLVEDFRGWTLDDFWRLQLGDILITDFRSAFRRPMRGRLFSGEVSIVDVSRLDGNERWDPLVVLRTECRYAEAAGGECHGGARIAITNPPERQR